MSIVPVSPLLCVDDTRALNLAHAHAHSSSASTIPDGVLVFTVVMGAAFVRDLFPPHVGELIQKHAWVKHIIALAFLLVTIIWVQNHLSIQAILGYTLVVYVWFLALSTMSASAFFIVLALLFVVFASSHLRKDAQEQAKTGPQTPAQAQASANACANASADASANAASWSWQQWLECAALVGAVSLTAMFTAAHGLRCLMR